MSNLLKAYDHLREAYHLYRRSLIADVEYCVEFQKSDARLGRIVRVRVAKWQKTVAEAKELYGDEDVKNALAHMGVWEDGRTAQPHPLF